MSTSACLKHLRQFVNGVKEQRAARGELQFRAEERRRVGGTVVSVLSVQLGAAHEDERTGGPRRDVHRVRDRLLPCAGRPGEEQRLRTRRLLGHGSSKRTNRCAVANERTVNPAACVLQEILRDAQLALQRSRSLRHAHLERRVHRLQLAGGPPALFVELRVVDRAGDMVGDDRDQVAVVLGEGPLHRTLNREHADQLIADEQRDGELALRIRQTGNRNGVCELGGTARLHHLLALRRRVGALLSEVAHVQHLAPLRDDADHAGAHAHASADRLVFVAAARHDDQRVAARLEQQDVGVMELEQLSHCPEGGVVNLVELECGVELG